MDVFASLDDVPTGMRLGNKTTGSGRGRWRWPLLTASTWALVLGGCGVLSEQRTVFPDEMVGPEGQRITVAQIDAILDDEDLSSDEQEAALHELGLEDERLIAILLR